MLQVVYRCGDCTLDTANRRFLRGGSEYSLEPKVFAVLVELIVNAGELVTRHRLLDAVWGHRYVTPSTLNRVVALARRALADDADEPKFIKTVHGAGYRYVGAVEKALPGTADPRARFEPPVAVRMPARLQTLIGREHELEQIGSLLRVGRSLTILGTGGMGKTQCALAFAHAQTHSYPDGIWFFDLAPMRRADEWLQAVAVALSIAPSVECDLLGKIAQTLAGRQALFMIDNCDRLSADVGALIINLLLATDRLDVVATSQQKLNFIGERVLRMPPLRLPALRHPSGSADLSEIAAAPAVALLLARIRDTQPDFQMTVGTAPSVVDICERLDGMPLALELAAARFTLLTPDQVLARLDQRFRFLVSDVAGRDPRHRNLIALLDWSFGLLSPAEQRFLACLGVFVQGWTVEGIVDLASAFDHTPEETIDLLISLVNKSLVSVDEGASPPRYRLLESVREFALQKLAMLGDESRARDAHLAYVLRLTEAANVEMLGGRMRERIAVLRQEHGNIDSASEYAATAAKDTQAALKIAGLLTFYFKAHGNAMLAKRLCERALSIEPAVRSRERGLALMCRGVNAVMGQKDTPHLPLLEAISIANETNDQWTAAYSSGFLALWFIHCGRARDAVAPLESLERVAAAQGDDILRSLAGLVRGWKCLAEDDIEEALVTLRSVRNLGGDYHQHHFIDVYIGLCLFRLGDYISAAAQWYEAMRNAIAVGHVRGVAGSVEGCAYIAERSGRSEQACRFLSAAAHIRTRAASPLFSFWIRHNQFASARLRESLGAARYDEAISIGAGMREETVVNEAGMLLQEFAAAPIGQ